MVETNNGKIYCKTGGCGAKLGPAALSKVLSKIKQIEDPNLLVGFDSSDDAAVYKLNDDIAVVQTLDFFPPMVSDPYTFGQIAATNALSDIYAMGGTFKTALNIVCFPQNEDLNVLGKIIEGGSDKVKEAGGSLVGGHSINDTSIKYGLSVMGTIHPDKVYKNNKAQAGDVLILTKPLGVGIITSANNVGLASEIALNAAIESMTCLNKAGSVISCHFDVSACTDVTGFGLIAHLLEMLGKSRNGLVAYLNSDSLPYIKESYEYAMEFCITAAGQRNRNFAGKKVKFMKNDFAIQELVFDPQTSGGLLFAVNPNDANGFLAELKKTYTYARIIGRVEKEDFADAKIFVE